MLGGLRAATCVAALAWMSATGLAQGQQERAVRVRVAPVVEESIEQKRQVTGDVRAIGRSQLAAQEPGLVIEVLVDEGARVKQGDVVARLDPEGLELDLVEAKASVLAAEAKVAEEEALSAQAARDRDRIREMLALESGSKPELDRAESQAAAEAARLEQARAQLAIEQARQRLIEKRLGDLEIRAPFSGRVTEKFTEVGQWVQAGSPVVEVVSLDPVEIRVDVPERFVSRVIQAETVSVMLPGVGQEVSARVIAVIPRGDMRSRLFPLRLLADNPEELIKPGMSAIGLVPTSERAMTLLVPKDAVLQGETGSYVYFEGGGRAAIAPVERLFAIGDRVAVRSATLRAGMSVVVEGNERMRPGSLLEVIEDPAPSAEPGA
ncbi:MAG: efflux RND transporter periplasmic adaptor subunit [Phycisphaerales bacterium]|nr:efflux RND transporter periplasmic adaptor subunit [Phycisphaerales bacterium]